MTHTPDRTIRSAASETAQQVNLKSSRMHARYVEASTPERDMFRTLRAAAEDRNLLRHLGETQLTALERSLKGLRLEADLQAGRAHDVIQAATDLIDAVIAEQRTRS